MEKFLGYFSNFEWVIILLLLASSITVLFWPWWTIKRLRRRGSFPEDRLFELRDESRRTCTQIAGGLVLFFGLIFTWRNIQILQSSQDQNRQAQIADRFNKAIEFLGSRTPAVRAGGLFALERLCYDAPQEHWRSMEVLTQYLRHNSRRPQQGLILKTFAENQDPMRLTRLEIETSIRIIGRREVKHDPKGKRLDLTGADLSNIAMSDADFSNAVLSGTSFDTAELRNAKFLSAELAECSLSEASIQNSNFDGANMSSCIAYRANLAANSFMKTDFSGANLSFASFRSSTLSDCNMSWTVLANADFRLSKIKNLNLTGAELKNADFRGVDMTGVVNLTLDQLKTCVIDETTKLPDGFVIRGRK